MDDERSLASQHDTYLLEKAKLIFANTLERERELNRRVQFGLISAGAAWAWVLSRPAILPFEIIAWLPMVLLLCLAANGVSGMIFSKNDENELYNLEKRFGIPDRPRKDFDTASMASLSRSIVAVIVISAVGLSAFVSHVLANGKPPT